VLSTHIPPDTASFGQYIVLGLSLIGELLLWNILTPYASIIEYYVNH
jgi:hypothetical protein